MKIKPNSLRSLPLWCLPVILLIIPINFQQLQANSLSDETDKLALLHFKDRITTDPHGVLKSWNNSIPFCNWFGIACSKHHQRVTSLTLQGQKLSGPISQHIGNLSFLRSINLQNNSFHGAIPDEVGKLSRLHHLILNNNTLEGEIPVNLSSCSHLKSVYLESNNIGGNIPAELGFLMDLQDLSVGYNSLTGNLPTSLGNLSTLKTLSVVYNHLVGSIPSGISQLNKLNYFNVGGNNLSGAIPPFLFNISSITFLCVASNKLDGSLPDNAGFNLPNLRYLEIGANQISGRIPSSLSNASQLQVFDITINHFEGPVPSNLGDLRSLWYLNLAENNLGSGTAEDFIFFSSLQNCKNLIILDIHGNRLRGALPDSMGNFSFQLAELYVGGNQIFGRIPAALDNFSSLYALGMEYNLFIGEIPSYFGKLQKMQELHLNGNRLSGSIPSSIGNLTQLSKLDLFGNNLDGPLPSSIGQCKHLNYLFVEQNNLTGAIPKEILSFHSLIYLDLSDNLLTGSLPIEVGKLTTIYSLDVSDNILSGEIPSTIGDCLSLEYLGMRGNSLQGNISESMAYLKGLTYLDLSKNNLTGEIPKALQDLAYLFYLNISFNDLEGEVPKGGVFRNASAIFLSGNSKLCGGIPDLGLRECPTKLSKRGLSAALKITIISVSLLLCGLLLTALLALLWKTKSKTKSSSSTFELGHLDKISYRSLHDATDGFSPEKIIGSGGFGTVYKGFLHQSERPIAVKVLNLEQKGASKSVLAECHILKNIRHRNLVKVITYCSSLDYKGNDFKALVFELMKNGSLEHWLHPDAYNKDQTRTLYLDLLQRLNIAIDVASALHYLHDFCEVPIIHGDLKPSNVLLDHDLVAHVSDFGLARFVSNIQDSSQSKDGTSGILGTIGYVAPEYGLGGRVSKEADVYSYGILVLEMFTGRRPTDHMFTDGLNVQDFVKQSILKSIVQVVDPTLIVRGIEETQATTSEGHGGCNKKIFEMRSHEHNFLVSMLEIGVSCSTESSIQRPKMADVLKKLCSVKDAFLNNQLQRGLANFVQPVEDYQ